MSQARRLLPNPFPEVISLLHSCSSFDEDTSTRKPVALISENFPKAVRPLSHSESPAMGLATTRIRLNLGAGALLHGSA